MNNDVKRTRGPLSRNSAYARKTGMCEPTNCRFDPTDFSNTCNAPVDPFRPNAGDFCRWPESVSQSVYARRVLIYESLISRYVGLNVGIRIRKLHEPIREAKLFDFRVSRHPQPRSRRYFEEPNVHRQFKNGSRDRRNCLHVLRSVQLQKRTDIPERAIVICEIAFVFMAQG
jgi:hypothetical protein